MANGQMIEETGSLLGGVRPQRGRPSHPEYTHARIIIILRGGRGKGSLFCWRLQIQYFCYTYAGITVILKLMEDDRDGYNRGATRWRLPVQLYYFENAGIVIFLKLVGGDTHNHYPQGHRITTAGKMVLFYASRNRNDFEVVGDERWTDWQTKVWIKEIIYMRIDSRRLDECRNKIDFFGIYRYT